jgi:hypothetical protein
MWKARRERASQRHSPLASAGKLWPPLQLGAMAAGYAVASAGLLGCGRWRRALAGGQRSGQRGPLRPKDQESLGQLLALAMQVRTSVYKNALPRRHQRRIRYRRADRSGHAKAAIRHSRPAAVCRKTRNIQLDQYCQHDSSAPPRIWPGANHHNGIS